MAHGILNIRVPAEMEREIKALAQRLGLKPSTTARILLRRALGEPVGVAVIKEKVTEIHALMRARQSQLTSHLRDELMKLVDDLAPEVDVPELDLSIDDEHPSPATNAPAAIFEEGEEPDHGVGVRFSGPKKTGDARGRRKR